MIANKNVALPQAKNKKTTKRSRDRPTAMGRQLGSSRTAAAIVSGASIPVAMINKNAMPCIQPCQVAGLPPLGRSDRRERPSRLGEARRFLASWSCEFDSRHPL